MKFEEMQEEAYKIVDEYNEKEKIKHNKDTVFHHLIEEVGELARHLHNEKNNWRGEKFKKEELAEEIVDVFSQILYLARDYEIDLEDAFKKKIIKLRKRFQLD